MKSSTKQKPELRQDEVTGEWVIIAPRRSGKPSDFSSLKRDRRRVAAKSTCPFKNIIKKENHKIISLIGSPSDWSLLVVANKYPALEPTLDFKQNHDGLKNTASATGFHELIITKSHTNNFAHLSGSAAADVLLATQNRFLVYQQESFALYGFFFHNWGYSAGASVYHPHYQLMSLPILPDYIKNSLSGSASYFRRTGRSAYADLIKSELKTKTRIISENKYAVALVPFAAKDPFHVRIFPKRDGAFFEQASPPTISNISELIQDILLRYETKLSDPDYNFFIHSAPLKNQSRYKHYRWHIDIIPKISVAGGVEVGMAIEVTPLSPDKAATFLRAKR